jgi:dipeptidyl aminopeptidase/acylaminoacyl peptidase
MLNRFVLLAAIAGSCLGVGELMGDDRAYQLPPQEVIDIIDAPPEPAVRFSPNAKWMLLIERDAMPDIADVSRRKLQLAGLRIDPVSNGGFQTSFSKAIKLQPRSEVPPGSPNAPPPIDIPLEEGAKVSAVSWAHDSQSFVYTIVTDHGQQLWIASVNSPTQPKLLTDRLNTVTGGFDWMPDAQHVLCKLVPENRAIEPASIAAPTGPNIQESYGNTSPTRTYQDLLADKDDERMFDYYAKAQLAIIGMDGSSRKIGSPEVFAGISPSPNGEFILVTTIHQPYSYLLTYRSFPRKIQVWDLDGKVVYQIADVPMDENIPIEGVRTGPRNVDWKSGEAATLVWSEALDGGDPNVEAKHRDQNLAISAPFDTAPRELMKVEHRAFGMSYFSNPSRVMTTEYDRDRRWVRMLMHKLDQPGSTPVVLVDRSIRDRYGDPGRMATVPDETGHRFVRQDGDWIYRSGQGASPKGNLPFFYRQNIKTLETERLWRCAEGTYEAVVAIADTSTDAKPRIITDSESPATPPNYFLRDLNDDSVVALTDFKDPTPQIRGIKKQLVKYKRDDGVDLSATLYLPADYVEGTRLPLMVWAYPTEFNDADTAGQISGTPHRFTRMRSITHLTLLTQGYAIMDGATMPIIGDPETMNDTFIKQVVSSAKAAIDKAVEMGVADPQRVGVGGHSYGAFMTANLLAHSDLFQAGVARSGAYNRTLTPFGFQSERRPFWQAADVYFNVSPFMHADKINEPLLLIHGENDNNSGTFPTQSRRMYQAIKGNGGDVRLCMLPHESHGYRARQSVLHTQHEMIAWLNKYVKNAPMEKDAKSAAELESNPAPKKNE